MHRTKKRKSSSKYNTDRKSTIKSVVSIIIIILIMLTFFFYSDFSNYLKQRRYEGETVGNLISYHQNKGFHQSHEGATERTLNFEITYTFVVKGKVYSKSIYLNANKVSMYYLKRISSGEEELIVKYDIDDPNENTIVIE